MILPLGGGENGCGYKTQYFNRAIQKYGWNNIKHEIIANNLTHDEACAFEKRLINKLQSNNLKYGYNLTSGGEGTCGISNYKDKNPFYGKKHSQETKIKMSKHHYDCSGCNNPSAKRVVNVTDKIVYNTIKEANNAMGFYLLIVILVLFVKVKDGVPVKIQMDKR